MDEYPPVTYQARPVPHPAQNPFQQQQMQPSQSSKSYLPCIIVASVVLALSIIIIVLLVVLLGSGTDLGIKLESHVDMFPDDHAMGDVILHEGNFDYVGILDGKSMTLEIVRV